MFSPRASRLRDWRAALLLVAVACLTPERGQARCGNHTTIFKPELVAAAQPAEAEAPAPVAPCHGPDCSRLPNRDAPPPAAAPVTPQTMPAALDARPPSPRDPRSGFARDGSSAEPVRRPSSVFHPPRHV